MTLDLSAGRPTAMTLVKDYAHALERERPAHREIGTQDRGRLVRACARDPPLRRRA